MEHIPNFITALRIIASAGLLCTQPFSAQFFCLYLLCGLSDVLDGYLARKMQVASPFGQVLDSAADVIFIGAVLFIFIPVLNLPLWIIRWMAAIAGVRLVSVLLGFIRYRQPAFLHTCANKATGIALFSFPILMPMFGAEATATLICLMASVSAAEELLINGTAKTLHRDRRSIFKD